MVEGGDGLGAGAENGDGVEIQTVLDAMTLNEDDVDVISMYLETVTDGSKLTRIAKKVAVEKLPGPRRNFESIVVDFTTWY